ncbi:MAG: hypothetical protein WA137_07270 [Methanothrix sp.]
MCLKKTGLNKRNIVDRMDYKMRKIFCIVFMVVLISAGSAQSEILSGLYDMAIGKPNINLEDFYTEVGFPGLSGYPIDCTFTLTNTGDANGLATVDIETEWGQLLKKLVDLKVPKKTPSTYNVKFYMPCVLPPLSNTIIYRVESQRSATSEEWITAIERGVTLLK